MANDHWYRNTDWSAVIEADFQQRLRRTRDKAQRLRIQATYLAKSHPHVALQLLDQYFAVDGDHIDIAAAHVARAEAFAALHDTSAAILAYESAIERERQFPQFRTGAYLDLACLVAESRVARLYSRALQLLDEYQGNADFPVERYRAHGARALVLVEQGRKVEAQLAAARAMAAARVTKSGFRNHPKHGLAGGTDDEFGRRVALLALTAP